MSSPLLCMLALASMATTASATVVLPGGYVLVFRATAGITDKVYEAYTNVGYNDDHRIGMPCGCVSVNGNESCDRHYRSSLLDAWPSNVRVSWYLGGQEEAYIEFDGTGSTYLNWFSASNVDSSTWTDLGTETNNFFTIEGHSTSTIDRRFFINRNYGGCGVDKGWSVVLEESDACSWGQSLQYPAFLYSSKTTYAEWNTAADVGSADVLVIGVKFLSPVDI
ncbi:hypothetical protein BaRGS_00036619 [Batillaria attramentaria]|uniref:Uncharacterized protein n=1 Tax=Batillaria attramentaria TaxID=370345 RepID=A0ABD0JB13_9CAEN